MKLSRKASGFTLVEILIVVIILGILAAIVIPQFTNASQDARRSGLASTVQTLRSQIELYKLQHGDALPDLVTDWTALTETSVFAGKTFGPYMQSVPSNPMVGSNPTLVTNGTVATDVSAGATGFVYDYNAGAGSGKLWGVQKNEAGDFVLIGD